MTVTKGKQRLPRAERRAQIIAAATRAFARHGYTATGLDDIAQEAAVTRVVLYRHFDSKAELYRTILEGAVERLARRVGTDDFEEDAIPALLAAAAEDPDAFRLLFRFANREREFRDLTDSLSAVATDAARTNLATQVPTGPWLEWAAQLIPTVTTDAVIAWLENGQPEPDRAAARIRAVVHGVIDAAARDE